MIKSIKDLSGVIVNLCLAVMALGFASQCTNIDQRISQIRDSGETVHSFDSVSTQKVISYIDKQEGPFDLSIDSFGGSVYNGNLIARALERASARGAISSCTVRGAAYSMGFVVLQYCDIRAIAYGATLMQHMPHSGSGYENLTFRTHESRRTYMFFVELNLYEEAARLGITPLEYLRRYMYSKWYRTPKEMCKDNVIDFYTDVSDVEQVCQK